MTEKSTKDVERMENIIKDLENNLTESKNANNEPISNHQEESYELISFIHEEDANLTRQASQNDVNSSYSTISIVHLQYKYEELLASHYGLLKLLEIKSDEIKKLQKENYCLKTENDEIQTTLKQETDKIHKYGREIIRMRERKNQKIRNLEIRNEDLQLTINQLGNMLHAQCMERDQYFANLIKNCTDSSKALLLQEMRRNNLLIFQNFQLKQSLKEFKIQLGWKKGKCCLQQFLQN